jgi:ribosomal protein S18 acetylase RimI-like enzyme
MLIEKIEQTALGHFKYLPERCGFPVTQTPQMTVINCGLGSSMFNIVFGAVYSNVEQIQKTIEEFDGQPFAWWIPPSKHSDHLSEQLQNRGFTIEVAEHAMICDLSVFEAQQLSDKVNIVEVTKPSQLNDFIQVLEPYDHTARLFYEQLKMPMPESKEKLFVGYKEDKPVTIGILFHHNDTAGIFSILTDECMRGQGIGTQVMRHLMSVAKELGASYASLSASSDSGFRIYERLGFKTLGQFDCFEWKGR